jgi:gentisate 1,2-dioxygenase/alkylhydroperoxidase family enzyme
MSNQQLADQRQHTFVDRTDFRTARADLWPSVVIPREDIEAEVDRLAALPQPENGRRRSLIVHPRSEQPGLGLAPGIAVSLDVLLPGEETAPIRHNSSQVNFCIRGEGSATIDGTKIDYERLDVFCTPSMATYAHRNTGDDISVRLTYSNAALLEKLNVHFVDERPAVDEERESPTETTTERAEALDALFDDYFQIDEAGAWLMSYERLVNPRLQESKPLLWKWSTVKENLDKLTALGSAYQGRRLYLLYNPVSGRTNGTTHNFFATMCVRPANIVDVPHRHTAAAINYFFEGSGYSVVGGKTVEWKAGDLMLSAPGWAVHHHASHDNAVYELTIQDSPLHLAMDSLLWQENLRAKPILLGSHRGFDTNRTTQPEVPLVAESAAPTPIAGLPKVAGPIDAVALEAMPADVRELLEPRVLRLGYLGAFFSFMGHQPAALKAFYEYTDSLKSALSDEVAEAVALTVATRLGNDYERIQHERLAAKQGRSPEWIAAVEAGRLDEVALEEQLVCGLVTRLLDGHGHDSTEQLAAAVEILGQEATVAVLMLVGRFVAHGYISNALQLTPPAKVN